MGKGSSMRKTGWLVPALLLAVLPPATLATGWRKDSSDLGVLNKRLRGKVVDHTANHGEDRRIWSRSMYQRRDAYVYLPPGFDRSQHYPLLLWLHGFGQDEKAFVRHIV